MRVFPTDQKRQYILVIAAALVIALLAELVIMIGQPRAEYSENSLSLVQSDSVSMTPYQYIVNGTEYRQNGGDPQLVFSGVDYTFDRVLISFAKPVYERPSVQLYYCTPDSGFSQEKSTGSKKVPFGASYIIMDVPKELYAQLRVDINGDFLLADVVATSDPIDITYGFTKPFRILRFMMMFAVIAVMGCALLWWAQKPKSIRRISGYELAFCAACFVFYALWAIAKPLNYAPDEAMRYEVHQFMFEHNRLPVGEELISHPWGFTYAHFPIVLCNQLGYVFMKAASLFTTGSFKLLVAARMVSVCAGTGIVYYTIKISRLMFRSPARFVMIAFVAFMPQFAFLSSYVNNDSLALLGTAMIIYAWALAGRYKWGRGSALLLAVGVAVCGLAYYNSYSWILLSIVFFVVSYYYQNRRDHKNFTKMLLFIVAVVVALIGFNFIRHVVLYGDLLGFKTRRYYGELYGIEALKPSVSQSPLELGVSFWDMLFGAPYYYAKTTWKSFVGVFSYMNVFCPASVYNIVRLLMWIAVAGLVLKLIFGIVQKKRVQPMKAMMVICMVISAGISIGLAVYKSYTGDYQPQGRYCYPAFIAIAYFVAKGIEAFITLLKRREHQYAVTAMLCTAFAALSYYVYATVYLPS